MVGFREIFEYDCSSSTRKRHKFTQKDPTCKQHIYTFKKIILCLIRCNSLKIHSISSSIAYPGNKIKTNHRFQRKFLNKNRAEIYKLA